MSSNDGEGRRPPPTIDGILERMCLTHPGDKALLMKLVPWIQTQRPKFMYTSVLSIAVLLQRMARAFSMRSSPGMNAKRPAIAPTSGGTVAPAAPPSHPGPAAGTAPPSAPQPAAARPVPALQQSQQQQPPAPQQKPKKKAFRSAKKLDLSPNVVASLKGFVGDLASVIPLILEHVEEQRRQQFPNLPISGTPLTAVDTIEVCLHMMEGEVATSQPNASTKVLPNAAMEVYRKILDRAISGLVHPEGQASTMDQLKFKTFCVKTLESAQSRTVAVVESLHDFRLLWNVSSEQHALQFVPKDSTSFKQEELAWKLAFFTTWKRQEEHPNLCTRRERILAATTSLIILCVFPLIQRHTESEAKEAAPSAPTVSPNPEPNTTNKRPMEGDNSNSDVGTAPKVARVGASVDVHKGAAPTNGSVRQERTLGVVMHASRNASSFLKWAQPKPNKVQGGEAADSRHAGIEIERKELDQELLKVMRELTNFSKFSPNPISGWIECMKSAVGLNSTDDSLTMEMAEKTFVTLLETAFNAIQREEDERRGTRVEAVPYIEELGLMQLVRKGYDKHLCKTTNDRQRDRDELIACVPLTSRLMGEIKNAARRGSTDSANISEYQAKPVNPRSLMMEGAQDNFIAPNHAISPPVMTEQMELNEWTIAVLSSLTRIQPSPKLRSLLNQDPNAMEVDDGSPSKSVPNFTKLIIPLLNRFLIRMQKAATGGSRGPMPMMIGAEGEMQTRHRTQDTQFWAAIIQLYYHVLESILFFEKGAASSPAVKSAPFHEALMACSYLCIARAVTITGKMHLVQPESHQVYSILPIVGSTPYTYLKVTESFLRALTLTIPGNEASNLLLDTFGTLPRILQREVHNSEVHVIESLLWVRDNSRPMAEGCIVNMIAELKQANCWPPECLYPKLPDELADGTTSAPKERFQPKHPDFAFVSYIMRKLLKVACFRIQSICKALGISSSYPVSAQVWLAFRFLLRNQVELLYGRHVDQWILCTIYGVCKVMKYEPIITFGKAIEGYKSLRGSELGISTCEAIVRHVKILDAAGDADDQEGDQSYGSTKMGNILNLYNLVWVPIMKNYLLHSKALKRDKAKLKLEMVEKTSSAKPKDALQANGAPVSKVVSEGNVATIQLTLGGGQKGQTSRTTTAARMMDQQENDPSV